MNHKNIISLLLTGVFLMNIFAANATSLFKAVTGEDIAIVNPFCKKQRDSKTNSKSETADYPTAQAVEVSTPCTSVYYFENSTFAIREVEDNFETDVFTDSFRSDLFSKQLYIPPKS